MATSPRSGLRLALAASAPSCTFPAEEKFPAWPGLPAAPEFPVFEEASGREEGAVYSKAGAARRQAPSASPDASQLCLWKGAKSLSKRVSGPCGKTMGTRIASAPPVFAGIPFLLPAQLLPLLCGLAPLPPQECLLVCSMPVVSL